MRPPTLLPLALAPAACGEHLEQGKRVWESVGVGECGTEPHVPCERRGQLAVGVEGILASGQQRVVHLSISYILTTCAQGTLLGSRVGVPSLLSLWMSEAEQVQYPQQPCSYPWFIRPPILAVCCLCRASADGILLAGVTCGPV